MKYIDFNWVYITLLVCSAVAVPLCAYFDYRTTVETHRIDQEKRPCTP